MPLPRWLAQVSKRVFNPRELAKGERPVLIHVGRSSGTMRRTPLDAHPIAGGYLFVMNYGRDSDWVKNIVAAGTAELQVGHRTVGLVKPRIVSRDEAAAFLPPSVKLPPGFLNITECLQMDLASDQ